MTDIDTLTDEQLTAELERLSTEASSPGSYVWAITSEAARALHRHGYDWTAYAAGVSGGDNKTWTGANGVLLRAHVCELDGVIIDGHTGSRDTDGACIYCRHGWEDD